MKTADELTQAFRERGLKVTPQRQLIFRLLSDNDRHPSADVLFATASLAMPGISLRTIYQTLTDLTAMGELQALDVGTGATRFDPNVDDHHHIVCETCGNVRDVYVDGVQSLTVRQRYVDSDVDSGETADLAGQLGGFRINSTQVVFRGTCPSCLAHSA